MFCPRSNSLATINVRARLIFMIANSHISSMLSDWYGEQTKKWQLTEEFRVEKELK